MSSGIFLVIVVAAAYFAAHVAFEWIGRRWLVVSGAEYLLLGILLGPQVSGVLSPDTVQDLAPISTLALGWMGTVVGARFYVPSLVRIPRGAFRVALAESCITFLVVTLLEVVAIMWLFDAPLVQALLPALALGGIATASSSAGVQLGTRGLDEQDAGVMYLSAAVLVNAVIAVVIFGLLASIWHPSVVVNGRPLTATEWMAITIGIGALGGILFQLFLGDESDPDRLFVALAGGIILVSGAASHVGVSPLLSTLVFGAMLVNISHVSDALVAALDRVQRPLYVVLLLFAGAAWQPSTSAWALPVALFLAARIGAKVGGARLAARMNGAMPILGRQWGWALVGQGGLALAIALNYVYQDGGTLPYFVFTAAITSVLVTDLLSARFVRGVLGAVLDQQVPGTTEPDVKVTEKLESVPSSPKLGW
jgi:hypothetical protein